MDFVVDGKRLGQALGRFLGYADVTDEYVPVLVTDWPAGPAIEDLDRLLGSGPTAELGGRTALYVCAECGDLGCGAVTALVEVGERRVVWSEFGYQNNYEPFDTNAVFDGAGPLVFDRHEYSAVLERFRAAVITAESNDGDVLG
jgi:hypothetical protein